MVHWRTIAGVLIAAHLLAGCAQPDVSASTARLETSEPAPTPGGCFATDPTPAVIETTIEDVLVSPAVVGTDGSITSPAQFRSVTRQNIVQERRDVRFKTPCPPVMDEAFLATLQRALKARGHYSGPINSTMDEQTTAAIRSYQSANGLNSAVLSMATARALGLLV
jgi:hypothetical protein